MRQGVRGGEQRETPGIVRENGVAGSLQELADVVSAWSFGGIVHRILGSPRPAAWKTRRPWLPWRRPRRTVPLSLQDQRHHNDCRRDNRDR
jgi:hypothetical protein